MPNMNKPIEPSFPNLYLKARNVIKRWELGTHEELPFDEFKTEINNVSCSSTMRRFLRIDRVVELTDETNDNVTISLGRRDKFCEPRFRRVI